jgi:hypothetical protein
LTSKNTDCSIVHTACLVCFISTVNGRSNKKRKEVAYPWNASASSGHITNLKKSILETFDIYDSFTHQMANGTVHIRHQCSKTTVLSCHRCLIHSGIEKRTIFKYRFEL